MEKTVKYTPGEWASYKSQVSNRYLVLADDDLIIAADITNKDDADLLAAAHDMFKALVLCLPIMHADTSAKGKADYSVVRAAIAKAEGEVI